MSLITVITNGLADKQYKEIMALLHSIKQLVNINTHKITNLMATVAEIQAQVDALTQQVTDLQTSIDAKQEAIATAVAAFEKQIADLQAQIAAGGVDPAALQAIADKLTTAKDALAAAKADLEGTPLA